MPEGTVITGLTRLQGERMEVEIEAVSHNGSVLPVELEVYSTDGQKGILVPNSLENDAVKEICPQAWAVPWKAALASPTDAAGADSFRRGARTDTRRVAVFHEKGAHRKDNRKGRVPDCCCIRRSSERQQFRSSKNLKF